MEPLVPASRSSKARLGRTRRSQSEHIYNLRSLDIALPKKPEEGVEDLYHRLPDGMLSPKSAKLKDLSDKVKRERRKSDRLKMKGRAWSSLADTYKAKLDDYEETRDKIRGDVDDLRGRYKSDDSEFQDKFKELETSRVAEDEKDDRRSSDRSRGSPRRSSSRRGSSPDSGRRGATSKSSGGRDDSRRSSRDDSRRTGRDDYGTGSRRSGDYGDFSRSSGGRRPSQDSSRRGSGEGLFWMTRAERREFLSRSKKGALGRAGRRNTAFF